MIPFEYKTYELMVLPHSTWVDTGDDDDDDDDGGGGDDDDDDDDDDCKCGATSGLDGISRNKVRLFNPGNLTC